MDTAIRGDQDTLKRIAAVLLSLAVLAERASGRSVYLRWMVLWLLYPAEALAREFVAALTSRPAFIEIVAVRRGDGSTEAFRLALLFRTLAAALDALSQRSAPGITRLDWPPRPGRPVNLANRPRAIASDRRKNVGGRVEGPLVSFAFRRGLAAHPLAGLPPGRDDQWPAGAYRARQG